MPALIVPQDTGAEPVPQDPAPASKVLGHAAPGLLVLDEVAVQSAPEHRSSHLDSSYLRAVPQCCKLALFTNVWHFPDYYHSEPPRCVNLMEIYGQ